MEYFVYMTNDCNLHCQYCSVLLDCQKAGLPIKPSYSSASLANFIQKVQKENEDLDVDIYFFGGEPSLEYPAIKKLVLQLKQLLPNYLKVKFIYIKYLFPNLIGILKKNSGI